MTTPGPSARWLLADGWDLGASGYMGEFVPPSIEEAVEELSSPFATAPIVLPVGFSRGGEVKLPLWADSTLQDLLDEWHGVVPADRVAGSVLCYGWQGAQALPAAHVPVVCECAIGYLSKVQPVIPSEKLSLLEATFKIGNMRYGVEIGHVVLPSTTPITTDDDTEGEYYPVAGTTTTAGGAGYLQLTALTLGATATDLAPLIIDSDDHIAWGTLVTFTPVAAAPAAERVAVTGTIEKYIASSWTWTNGADANSTASLFLGFSRF